MDLVGFIGLALIVHAAFAHNLLLGEAVLGGIIALISMLWTPTNTDEG